MADITACMGKGCPLKEKCYRYTCAKDKYYQRYFMEEPYKDGQCEEYWEK